MGEIFLPSDIKTFDIKTFDIKTIRLAEKRRCVSAVAGIFGVCVGANVDVGRVRGLLR